VIGNPPYVEFKNLNKEIKNIIEKKYLTATGKYDLYIPFLEFANSILKNEGVQTYICPTRFMHRDYGAGIRKSISQNNRILIILDFADAQIFNNATTYTGIFIFKKSKIENYTFKFKRFKSGDKINIFQTLNSIELSSKVLENLTWYFDNNSNDILTAIKEDTLPLNKCVSGIFQGIATGKDSVFIIDEETIKAYKIEEQILQKILKGKDISPYKINWSKKFLIYPYDKEGNPFSESKIKDNFPNVYAYLLSKKEELKGRDYFDKSHKQWFELWNQRNLQQFYSPKIITLDTASRNSFTFDENNYVGTTTVYSLIPNKIINAKTLLSILNSALLTYYHKKFTIPQAGGYFRYQALFIKDLPIKIPPIKTAQHLYNFVSYILFLNEKGSNNLGQQQIVSFFEQVIDGMVYELYFPELLQKYDCEIIKYLGELPEFTESMSDEEKMEICKTVYDLLNDAAHPVKIHLEKMKKEIPEIRIIEGLEN
jgi:hypothetical protein